jgi:hypothetical protein
MYVVEIDTSWDPLNILVANRFHHHLYMLPKHTLR